jgi:hypothetical protein
MVDPISASSAPPQMIRFKPDPGEPAVDVTASPRQSAYLVTAQEQRNETRLRNRAILRGEQVLYSRRAFNQTYENGSVVYTGGLTTVVSRDRQASPLREAQASAQAPASKDEETKTGRAQEKAQEPSLAEQFAAQAAGESEQDLAANTRELSIRKGDLENRKERAEARAARAADEGDTLQMQAAQREVNELERRGETIDREKRKVELQRLEERHKEAREAIGDVLAKNPGAAANSPGPDRGQGATPSVGRRLDLFI